MFIRRLTAAALACLLAGISGAARPAVLGIIVQADRAYLGANAASPGTTVYDGDRLSTAPGGTLGLRSGATMLYVASESGMTVHSSASSMPAGTDAELNAGTMKFSSGTRAAGLEVHACGAAIRATGDAPTSAEVTMIGPKELFVFARHGSLQVSYEDESEIIAAGERYRVILDAHDGDAAREKDVKSRRHKKLILLLIGAGAMAGVAIPMIHEGIESPDRP